ncbi:glycosyltransferase [Brachyspira intermedia]|uniref:glycosyltransferase n=1 Tax=Brachyspira intermedia TaxID=84377 RepID=UPI0030071823
MNKKTINKIAWWIPVKNLREKFRNQYYINKNIIPFVIASNQNYLKHATTLIYSILEHSNKKNIYKALFFYKDIDEHYLKKLELIQNEYKNFEIEFYENKIYENLNDYGRYSKSAFDRLYIPNILTNYNKVLYLDCDMVAMDDIAELYKEDISDYFAAVCKDYYLLELIKERNNRFLDRNENYKNLNWYQYTTEILKMKNPYNIFNSGMMLINLEKFRKYNIGNLCTKDLKKNHYVLIDQDALNKYLEGKVKYISNKWNLSVYSISYYDNIKPYLLEAAKSPGLLHYKPWGKVDLLFEDEYYKNFIKTPFSPFNNCKTNNVIDEVIKKDMCIGCGICANVCPHKCLDIKLNKYKEYNPYFNHNKCTNCGICLKYCPHSQINILKELDKVKQNPEYYGTENSKYYVAHDIEDSNRIKSASGGIVTLIAKYMLENKIVDGIIHGEMVENNRNGIHYQACISNTIDEIDNRRSSFYFAFTFDNIIKQLKNSKGSYLFIGVPCIIRAVKKLINENKSYQNIKIFTIALSCSHNVNGLFTDYLADSLNIDKKEKYKVNLRYKDKSMIDANNFLNAYIGRNFLIKENRFKTIFTDTWRSYYFAMNVCNYCSDFWGKYADVSIKDAWGRWANEDRLNKSIVISRNTLINEIIEKDKNIFYEKLDLEEMVNSQLITIVYKQIEAENKLYKNLDDKVNITNGLYKNVKILKISKKLYKIFGFKISYFLMKKLIERWNKL